mgnify:CR=1 FL=1
MYHWRGNFEFVSNSELMAYFTTQQHFTIETSAECRPHSIHIHNGYGTARRRRFFCFILYLQRFFITFNSYFPPKIQPLMHQTTLPSTKIELSWDSRPWGKTLQKWAFSKIGHFFSRISKISSSGTRNKESVAPGLMSFCTNVCPEMNESASNLLKTFDRSKKYFKTKKLEMFKVISKFGNFREFDENLRGNPSKSSEMCSFTKGLTKSHYKISSWTKKFQKIV